MNVLRCQIIFNEDDEQKIRTNENMTLNGSTPIVPLINLSILTELEESCLRMTASAGHTGHLPSHMH